MRLREDFPSRLDRMGQSHRCYTQAPGPPGRGPTCRPSRHGQMSTGPFPRQSMAPTGSKLTGVSGPLRPKLFPRLLPISGPLFSCSPRPLLQVGYLHPDWTPLPSPVGSLSAAPTIHIPSLTILPGKCRQVVPHPPLPPCAGLVLYNALLSCLLPGSTTFSFCCVELLPSSEGPE